MQVTVKRNSEHRMAHAVLVTMTGSGSHSRIALTTQSQNA